MRHFVDPGFYFSGLRAALGEALRKREDRGER
jgi:hypothetical protein